MLYQVKIKNYKKIPEAGIFLKNLASINYFIGENGSGKSSILQAIYQYSVKNIFPEINLPKLVEEQNISIKQRSDCKVLYINNDTQALLKYISKLNYHFNPSLDFIQYLKQDLISKYCYLDWGLFNFNQEQDSHSRLTAIKDIILSLKDKPNLILLETPENFLHPSLEKKLPLIFEEISKTINCQILIATHSPFVVSSSGRLEEKEKMEENINREDFKANQKVYLIKDGQTASKRGEVGVKSSGNIFGSDGYWGKKVGYIAAKMLGTGLEDFIVDLDVVPSKLAPTLVFCEGEGNDEDAKFYNEIFKNKVPRVLFVSSKSNSQTEFSFDILEDIKDGLSGDFKILMLRDRDHDFPTLQDLVENQEKNPNHRVLFRRAIECYIYTSENAENLLRSLNLLLTENLKNEINSLQRKVQNEAENGKLGHDYKERFIAVFKKVYKIASSKQNYFDFAEFKFALIKTIAPDTEIYYHLENDIFEGFK